jgi:hypothetical protein
MSEVLFEKDHQYFDFIINNIYSTSDLKGKKHYNVFVNVTANENDAKYLCNYINKYNAAYNNAKKNIIDGLDECESQKYSKLSFSYPVNLTKEPPVFTIICDSTLLPYKAGPHINYERVFFNPSIFRNANINDATDTDLLKSMTEFFSNNEIYNSFVNIRKKRVKAGICKGEDYLIDNNSSIASKVDNILIREYNKIFGQGSVNSPPYPLGCIHASATFDYDEAYNMLDASDRELLDIISEFRIKQIMYFTFINNSSYNNSKIGIFASYLDDDILINSIKTFMGRRLYSNYSCFMRAKEFNLTSKNLINMFNNIIIDTNVALSYQTNHIVAPTSNFHTTFWENLKKTKATSVESN